MYSNAEDLLQKINQKRHEASRFLLERKLDQAVRASREVDLLREEYYRMLNSGRQQGCSNVR